MVIFYVIGFLIWFVLTIIVTNLGSNRKIGGGLAFLLCFLTTPIIGLIVVALSEKKEDNSQGKSEIKVQDVIGTADELLKLSKLKEEGVLNDDEFDNMKKKLLSQQETKKATPDSYLTVTIKDLRNNKIETVSRTWWESWKQNYGEKTYEVIEYHD